MANRKTATLKVWRQMLHDGPGWRADALGLHIVQERFQRGRYVVLLAVAGDKWCMQSWKLVRRQSMRPEWRLQESKARATQLEAALAYTQRCEWLASLVCR